MATPFLGRKNKTPVDHFVGHIPFASLEGDKRPDKINPNPEGFVFCLI